jgi:stringent starvation protein B
VLGVYARETGEGMIFSDAGNEPPSPQPERPQPAEGKRAKLKVVK